MTLLKSTLANALVNNYDGIFLGDIKSHDIVQKGQQKHAVLVVHSM